MAAPRQCAAASRADVSLDRQLAEPTKHLYGCCYRALDPKQKLTPSIVGKFMDGNQIRKVLLEVVDELSKRPNTHLQSTWILQESESKLALGRQIEHQRALLTYFHDLFRLGHLAWGSDLLNTDPPFCHVTEQGRRTLANISRDPANPDGYLQYLLAKHSLSQITRSYVIEALATYNSGCFKASAVMIGVAAESIVLEVRDILKARLDSLERSKPKELMDWRVKTVLDAIEKLLNPKMKDMPKGLYERFESYWSHRRIGDILNFRCNASGVSRPRERAM